MSRSRRVVSSGDHLDNPAVILETGRQKLPPGPKDPWRDFFLLSDDQTKQEKSCGRSGRGTEGWRIECVHLSYRYCSILAFRPWDAGAADVFNRGMQRKRFSSSASMRLVHMTTGQ
jgi:hypothetical protein